MNAEAPCFAAMVLAAHYVALCPHTTVLLVQLMDPTKVTNVCIILSILFILCVLVTVTYMSFSLIG